MPDSTISFSVEGKNNGDITLFLSGNVGLAHFDLLLSEIQTLFSERNPSRLTVDLTEVEYLDSAGALFLAELDEEAEKGPSHLPLFTRP